VLMAGFGGQGMLLAGKVLAHAAMGEGLEVSWLPSYGPEMRGGTANVVVCISEEPIGSPLITSPQSLLVMNRPSMDKFAPRVKAGGVIVVNTSLVDADPERPDCTVVLVDARMVARDAGTERAANFVMLGAYVGASDVLPVEVVEKALLKEFTGRKAKFAPLNQAAFHAGVEAGRKVRVTA
jgi:2-oxoglutarate ferredoxin oxidoreductase subunit gamma